jgi:tRNA (cytidine/uridine-2'-O-)-methyltransferase
LIRLALFEPEIPQNTGTLMRLCACLDVALDLIEPMGFVLSDKHLQRAGMDYRDMATVTQHENEAAFWEANKGARIILMDTKGDQPYSDFSFEPGDIILMGKESSGVPAHVFDKCHAVLKIPMVDGCRSINVALAASMVLGEGLRQTRWLRGRSIPI